MRIKTVVAVSAIALSGMLLAGCGATSAPTTENTASSTQGAVTVQDAAGKDVTLPDGPAKRVVALEWEYGEILTTLGAGEDVVGLSDIDGYNSFVAPTVPLTGTPKDVGERLEPSVESIADLQPDVIAASARSIPESVRAQLDKIAPVLVLNMDDADDPLTGVQRTTNTLAKLVGDEEAGAQWAVRMKRAFDADAAKVSAAGAEGEHATFAYVSAEGSTVSIRMHVPGSAADAVLERIGLQPAWTDDSASGGLSYLDVEGLTRLPDDTHFLYWDEDQDPIASHLSGNAVWKSLPFVKASHVAGIAQGVWVYGGPESLIAFADEATAALRQN